MGEKFDGGAERRERKGVRHMLQRLSFDPEIVLKELESSLSRFLGHSIPEIAEKWKWRRCTPLIPHKQHWDLRGKQVYGRKGTHRPKRSLGIYSLPDKVISYQVMSLKK